MRRVLNISLAFLLFGSTLYALPRLFNVLYRFRWVSPPAPVVIDSVPAEIIELKPEPQKFKFYKNAKEVPPDNVLKKGAGR